MTATEVLELQKEKRIIDELVNRAAKELQEEIDFNVLAELFLQDGWTEVKFDPHCTAATAHAIKQWIDWACNGPVTSRGTRYLFREKSDAINFLLKWAD